MLSPKVSSIDRVQVRPAIDFHHPARHPLAPRPSQRYGGRWQFNNHNYHAGTVRTTDRHRRSIGFDYGHTELTAPEEWAEPRIVLRYPHLLRQYPQETQRL